MEGGREKERKKETLSSFQKCSGLERSDRGFRDLGILRLKDLGI